MLTGVLANVLVWLIGHLQ